MDDPAIQLHKCLLEGVHKRLNLLAKFLIGMPHFLDLVDGMKNRAMVLPAEFPSYLGH